MAFFETIHCSQVSTQEACQMCQYHAADQYEFDSKQCLFYKGEKPLLMKSLGDYNANMQRRHFITHTTTVVVSASLPGYARANDSAKV